MKRPRLLTGAALVAGAVGRPIAHSLSPVIHGAWIAEAGLDAAYVPFAPPDDAFERFVRGFRGGAIRGLNVTAPFKERALQLADQADPVARRCGSANVLLFQADGTVEARSTDGAGLLAALEEQAPDRPVEGARVSILGAGGAARAAAVALVEAGARRVFVLNRTAARAEELVFALESPELSAHGFGEAEARLAESDILINAAAGGPLPPIDGMPDGGAVLDMSYRPLKTALLRAAAARELSTVDGLSMLIHQARPSFEAFFGVPAPGGLDVRKLAIAAMRSAPAPGGARQASR